MVTGDGKGLAGRQSDKTGRGSSGGWTSGRRMTSRIQGGNDRGRSQDRDRRSQGGSDEGARKRTGGTWSRRSKVGPRPQPWWPPTVEPTEGGAMVEEGLPTPRGRPTMAEQVVVEPRAETESRWARATGRIQRAKAEQMALATEAEAGIRKAAVELERQRTKVEPEGRRSLTEGWGVAGRVESQGSGWSTTDQVGAGGTREPSRTGGLTGHGGEEGARFQGGDAGSKGQGGFRDSEAGGRDKGPSSHDADGDWQTCSDPTTQMVGWGWAEGLPGDSGGNCEDWYRGGGRRRLGGKSRQVKGSGMVCATHTHHIATPNTGSVADRGTTSVVISGQANSSGQTDNSGQAESSDEGGRRGGMSAYIYK